MLNMSMMKFSKFLQWTGGIVAALIGIVAVILVLHYGFVKLQDYGSTLILTPVDQVPPPYIHLGNQQSVAVLHPDQFFFVHVDSVRAKTCSASIHFRILSLVPDTSSRHLVVWWSYPELISVALAGTYEGDTLLRIPVWLPVGDYILDRYAVFTCDGLRIDPANKIAFRIELPINSDPPTVPSSTP